MKQKNKLISFLLAVILLASLASCNTTETSTGDTDDDGIGISSTGDAVTVSIDLANPVATTGVEVSGTTITITRPGEFTLSGEMADGEVLVEVGDEDEVTLILNGVTIHNNDGSAIAIMNAKDTYIELASGTQNILSDGTDYSFADGTDEPNATLFSKDDLHIEGDGSLTVEANYNDAIASKDDLKIKSGNITITSVDDGIRGKDSITIEGGTMNITAENDAIKSDNEEEASVVIEGGDITISAGDDAIHSEQTLTIEDGNILIKKSYEGLEAMVITLNGGNIDITSSDDGINVAGGADSSGSMGGGKQAGGMDQASEDEQLYINGGTIVINANGDGLDSNGYVTMTGGDVTVYGPTNDGNGPLDYNGTFAMTGGNLIAIGSSGMAQNITASVSTQNGVLIGLTASQIAGTEFVLKDSNGNIVASVTGEKTFQSVVVSNANLKTGETYTYYLNGVETGTFTIESVATTVGTTGGMGGGRGGMGMTQNSTTTNTQTGNMTPPSGDAGGFGGSMNADFEEMRTIMDKVRNGETLTDDEQTLYDEFEASRPQRGGNMMPPQ